MDLRANEAKWTQRWEKDRIFEADPIEGKPKVFVTFPFPYMNGPLHIGHAFTSTRVDVYARFKRMQGFNVLFPWAWHLTGEPIAGAAERVASGDESQIRIFREMDGVPEGELKKFVDPEYIARYYIKESKVSIKALGHSIDWRREFTTTSLHEQFNKFIEWQYVNLRERGYVVKGTHPVVWCPHDQSPTGDHDRLRGEGASPVEFILLKFPYDGAYLPAATLRPETIFGVTNMWINPDADYVRIRWGGEEWIVSAAASEKLKEQKDGVEIVAALKGSELIGKTCRHPLSKEEVLILPASFVDPANSSGVVMSVPSHAPYDYVALRDLQKNPKEAEKYGVDAKKLKAIQPISMIRISSFGEHPAIEISEKMAIKDQSDPRLEEATETIYKEEFYKGVLKDNTGEYAGIGVKDVKKRLVSDFEERGVADKMYELSEEVVCRCNTKCLVKILKDQWFLDFSDEAWKERVREALKAMSIMPEEARANFEYTIDWLEAKACARKSGMGTPLPWDKDWIVETLSDSTVYMAFYTIAKHINQQKIKGESLTEEVFDYIFYGEGDPKKIGEKNRINPEILKEMRGEFDYWMPVDMRNSAKELIPNHLTFFIFHHVALFPEKLPRSIAVNGMITIEGEKMSKSKGNFVTLKQALAEYGADATRATLLYAAEGLRDPDWRSRSASDMEANLKTFYDLATRLKNGGADHGAARGIDRWLLSKLQRHIADVTRELEAMNTRSAFQVAFYDVWGDVRWYLRRCEPDTWVAEQVLHSWVKLIAPYTPALSEELWNMLGGEGYVSLALWPKVADELVDRGAEVSEELVRDFVSDIESILEVTGKKPKTIFVYTAPDWKWKAYAVATRLKGQGMKAVMEEAMKDGELRKNSKEVSKYVADLMKDPSRLRFEVAVDESKTLSEAIEFFEREFGAKVEVHRSEPGVYDPMRKMGQAAPMKPAIYVE